MRHASRSSAQTRVAYLAMVFAALGSCAACSSASVLLIECALESGAAAAADRPRHR